MTIVYKELLDRPAPDGYFFAAEHRTIGWMVSAFQRRKFLWPKRVYGTSVLINLEEGRELPEDRLDTAYAKSHTVLHSQLNTRSAVEQLEAYLKER